MEVGALEFDGRKSDDPLAGPSEAGGAGHDFEDDGTAGVEARAKVADGERAFAAPLDSASHNPVSSPQRHLSDHPTK